MDGVSAPDAYLALVGMVTSVYVQWENMKQARAEKEQEEEKVYDFEF